MNHKGGKLSAPLTSFAKRSIEAKAGAVAKAEAAVEALKAKIASTKPKELSKADYVAKIEAIIAKYKAEATKHRAKAEAVMEQYTAKFIAEVNKYLNTAIKGGWALLIFIIGADAVFSFLTKQLYGRIEKEERNRERRAARIAGLNEEDEDDDILSLIGDDDRVSAAPVAPARDYDAPATMQASSNDNNVEAESKQSITPVQDITENTETDREFDVVSDDTPDPCPDCEYLTDDLLYKMELASHDVVAPVLVSEFNIPIDDVDDAYEVLSLTDKRNRGVVQFTTEDVDDVTKMSRYRFRKLRDTLRNRGALQPYGRLKRSYIPLALSLMREL